MIQILLNYSTEEYQFVLTYMKNHALVKTVWQLHNCKLGKKIVCNLREIFFLSSSHPCKFVYALATIACLWIAKTTFFMGCST